MELNRTPYRHFTDCVRLTDGKTEAYITVSVGPRIIHYSECGGENVLKVFSPDDGISAGGFRLYGGHRVWHAPEAFPRSYHLDDTPCELTEIENGVIVTALPEPTGLQKSMRITMEKGVLQVCNLITNVGEFDVELSVWGLSVFDKGGLLVVPQSRRQTGLVANRAISLWPYTKMNDPRAYYGGEFVTLKWQERDPYKIGMTVDEGYAAYFHKGRMVVKRFPWFEGHLYPNYECNFETYTNKEFIEIESLTPLVLVSPGETASLCDEWELFTGVDEPAPTDEKAIARALKGKGKIKLKHEGCC